jgi:hypothetical protein
LMMEALALNIVYLCAGFTTFVWLLQRARHRGLLLTMGE